jgi:hypothetical protein
VRPRQKGPRSQMGVRFGRKDAKCFLLKPAVKVWGGSVNFALERTRLRVAPPLSRLALPCRPHSTDIGAVRDENTRHPCIARYAHQPCPWSVSHVRRLVAEHLTLGSAAPAWSSLQCVLRCRDNSPCDGERQPQGEDEAVRGDHANDHAARRPHRQARAPAAPAAAA